MASHPTKVNVNRMITNMMTFLFTSYPPYIPILFSVYIIYHSVSIGTKKEPPLWFFWWSIADSNRWPQHCERCALPTELMPHISLAS